MNSQEVAEFLAECSERPFPEGLPEGYVPLELMAGSGLGQTFLCKDTAGGGLVIAKRCDANLARTEAEMLSRLSHPGLSTLVGISECAEGAFLLRSYVPGLPLDEYARRPMPEAEALGLMEKVLEILGYLHAQKPPVIHRDVKPSNIIVDPETGKLSLIDLGIARVCENETDGDTLCMGTREFAPPEQYGYMPTDPRADVFSSGKLLQWMLAGDESSLSRGLTRRIRRMTAFDPKWRYPDAHATLRALRRYREGVTRKAVRGLTAALTAVSLAAFGFWLGRYTQIPVAPMAAIFERDLPVAFSDAVLEARVRSQMGAPEGEIAARSAQTVRTLDLSAPSPEATDGERIGDISALSSFSNLRSLDLSWNGVKDISVLKNLTQLESLYLNGNGGISDLTPLQGLVNLKDIMLVGCPVYPDSDGVFRNMGKLKSFWVESRLLQQLDVVKYFPGLERLVVKNCSIRDLSPVAALRDLHVIDVSGNPIEDFTPLLKSTHLAYATFSIDQRALVEAQLSGVVFDIRYS